MVGYEILTLQYDPETKLRQVLDCEFSSVKIKVKTRAIPPTLSESNYPLK